MHVASKTQLTHSRFNLILTIRSATVFQLSRMLVMSVIHKSAAEYFLMSALSFKNASDGVSFAPVLFPATSRM